ncbi:S9 family peptidase [Sphingomonas adhaesiva]|uniref:S9 family peptidase n=1 Tax=Sphingomonas adhaesiva TaxID=28212 RepID=UPI002FF48A29
MVRLASMFAAAVVLLLAWAEPIAARSYTVEDALRTEDIGAITFDPQDRWLVFERLEPLLAMSRFDMMPQSSVLRTRLYRVDLDTPWRARPLLADQRPGTIVYDVSPDGDQLAIGRIAGDRWSLGIVSMRSGEIRWLNVVPDYDPFRTTLRWVSNQQLAAITLPRGELPWWFRLSGYPAEILPARWAATRSGAATAVTVVGSGRFARSGSSAPVTTLALIDVRSGEATRVAMGAFLSLDVSPDRQHLALIERGVTVPLPQTRPVSQVDAAYRRTPIIYDLRRGTSWRPCAECDQLGRSEWSADGRRIAILARRTGEDWPEARMLEIDVGRRVALRRDAGNVAPLVAELPDGSAGASFRWRGRDLLLFGRSIGRSAARPEWYVLRGERADPLTSDLADVGPGLSRVDDCAAAMSASDGLWCLDAQRPRRLYDAGVRPSRGAAIGWRETGDHITLVGSVLPGRVMSIAAGERVDGIEASATGRLLAIRRTAGNGVKSLGLVSRDREGMLAQVNLHLNAVQPAIVRRLSYSLPDGSAATGWLYLPPTARAGQTFSLVAIPYPGLAYGAAAPVDQAPGTDRLYTSAQLLAGGGYAVLLPSLPEHAPVADRVTNLVGDLDRAVDAAIGTGAIDPRRIALWGHSFGGYAVAMIATRSCRYASAIASAGIYDLAAVGGTFNMVTGLAPERDLSIGQNFAWAETGQGRFGAPPWVDPTPYVAASPVYQLGRIVIPMMIVAADHDISPLGQAQQLFSGLARQNKDAELVTYWGEDHVVLSPANLRDFYGRVFNWLERTVTPLQPERSCPNGSLAAGPSTPSPIAP